jgi:phosphatidylinositol alpha 1,6-mannosyltransferase
VTESFLPQVNGVTTSVLRVVDHARRRGHEVLVVAPAARRGFVEPDVGAPVVRVPSVPLPLYSTVRIARPWSGLEELLRRWRPDVVHLASPTVLGHHAMQSAQRLGLPTVAVFQTDLGGFASSYGLHRSGELLWRRMVSIHERASLTLAPSTAAIAALQARGVPRVRRWGRGVDLDAFHPRHRTRGAGGSVRVGYVGRLAREKRLELLAAIETVPGAHLVLVGDGPERRRLERRLPSARFTGQCSGGALSQAHADLDVFVHAGPDETFCQAAQEAKASGVPVVAVASGGLIDLVDHGTTGLLWRDTVQLRAGVELLVGDAPLRRRLGENARRSVLHRSWEVLGDQLLAHHRDAIGRPGLDRTVIRA